MGLFKKIVKKAAKVVGVVTGSSPLKKLVQKVIGDAKKDKSSGGRGIPKVNLINHHDVIKFTNPSFERFAANYTKSEPEMLFVAEYIVDDKFVGVLVAWEKFFDSTHYEVYKKNSFSAKNTFERILFLDAASLQEETKHYIDYIENTIGLDVDNEHIYIILDTVIKEDRVYEYKVKAARVPEKSSEVDYDFILESKNLARKLTIDQTSQNTLYDFSGVTFGSWDLAWTLSLLNETVQYFGKNPLEKPLVKFPLPRNEEGEEFILVPNNLNDIMSIINDSIALFGVKATFTHLIKVLGGLGSDFRAAFIDSIDETRNVFSYDNFRKVIKSRIPVFSLVLGVAESGGVGELSKLSIVLPSKKGSESLSSVEDITKILKFTNEFFLAAIYSQDNSSKVAQLLAGLKLGTIKQDPLAKATSILIGTAPIDNEGRTSNSGIQSDATTGKRRLPSREQQEEAKEQREEDEFERSRTRRAGDRTRPSGKKKKSKKRARVKK